MMNTKKSFAALAAAALVLTLAACGAKTEAEPEPTATPEVTAAPEPTATPEPDEEAVVIHDFDIYVDAFKDENDIEITSADDGTDIADTDALYTYLYDNGVTRQAVQADLDAGCDSPYIEGYLTYLNDLDKPSESADEDYQVAEDGSVEIEFTEEELAALEAAGAVDGDEWNEQVEDISDKVHDYYESGQLQKDLDDMFARHPEWSDLKKG